MEWLTNHSLPVLAAAFFGTSILIAIFGTWLTGVADQLAERTGIGEAITGGLFLGASTSLPGLITSITAASNEFPRMSVSNAVGGIAAQTAFLGIADICYRKANLEHAAASLVNLMQACLLVTLLCLPLLARTLPEWTLFSIHPVSPLLVGIYAYGMKMVSRSRDDPMWKPKLTRETQRESLEKSSSNRHGLTRTWAVFGGLALVVGLSGWMLARTGIAGMQRLGLSESLVGGLFTAVSSSLPELVTSIAAVRRRAFTLAVGGIIGGNAFDTLFLAASDAAYRSGSIFHAISSQQVFLITLAILMTAILSMGLVRREKRGIANIGFESFAILVLYAAACLVLSVQ